MRRTPLGRRLCNEFSLRFVLGTHFLPDRGRFRRVSRSIYFLLVVRQALVDVSRERGVAGAAILYWAVERTDCIEICIWCLKLALVTWQFGDRCAGRVRT